MHLLVIEVVDDLDADAALLRLRALAGVLGDERKGRLNIADT
jgi:hypothetical protein